MKLIKEMITNQVLSPGEVQKTTLEYYLVDDVQGGIGEWFCDLRTRDVGQLVMIYGDMPRPPKDSNRRILASTCTLTNITERGPEVLPILEKKTCAIIANGPYLSKKEYNKKLKELLNGALGK